MIDKDSTKMTNCVETVFLATTPEELAKEYDKWSTSYDNDLEGHAGPKEAAEQLALLTSKEGRILDAGCGTGLVGQHLASQGYQHLEALDLSTGMLQQARNKNCYSAFHQQALGGPLDLPDHHFDAIIIVGVFVMAHARSNAFDELIRITKPGGHILFTLRPEFYANTDFKPTMLRLETEGKWTLHHVTEPFHGRFQAHPEVNLQVWVYTIN